MPSESEWRCPEDKDLDPCPRRRYVRFRRRDRRDIERLVSHISSGQRRNRHRVGDSTTSSSRWSAMPTVSPTRFPGAHLFLPGVVRRLGPRLPADPVPVEADGSLKTPDGPSLAERRAHVLMHRVATRTEALAALHATRPAGRGTGPRPGKGRFRCLTSTASFEIYQDIKDLEPDMGATAGGLHRDVVPDPTTRGGAAGPRATSATTIRASSPTCSTCAIACCSSTSRTRSAYRAPSPATDRTCAPW